jgi:uncharacterized protein with ParB-like and HNH nuclease domain
MAEINTEKKKIGEIFVDNFLFKIPNFQRSFSWRKDNFSELFEDIYAASDENQEEYFLGSIILQREGESRTYSIIDGQQRLTSIAILLAVMRDKTKDENLRQSIQESLYEKGDKFKRIPLSFRIKMWKDLSDYKKYIYEMSKTNLYVEEFESGKIKYTDKKDPRYSLYEEIKTFSEEYAEKFTGNPGSEGKFVEYLFSNVYLVNIWTRELPYAIKLFNILNTTGLPLTTADILKAVNLAAIDEYKRAKYAEIWRESEDDIGRKELEKFIEFILTMKLKRKTIHSVYDEYNNYIFGKYFKKGEEFINYLKKIADIYEHYVRNPINIDDENKYRSLINLMVNYIPFDDWVPPLIYFYEKYGDYYQSKLMNSFLTNFLYVLERRTVIDWVLGLTFTKRLLSLIGVVNIIDENEDPEKVIEAIKNGLYKENLKIAFKEKVNGIDFYNESFAKYPLLMIDLEYVDKSNFGGYKEPITIERILPQNLPENSKWIEKFSEEEMQEWKNKIAILFCSGEKRIFILEL